MLVDLLVWAKIFPDKPWPGLELAFLDMATEIEAQRLLLDDVVAQAVESEGKLRTADEIQRAHDLVGQYCQEANDAATMRYVSALCWVLRHDHNRTFPDVLEAVEAEIARRGVTIVRLPEVVDPRRPR